MAALHNLTGHQSSIWFGIQSSVRRKSRKISFVGFRCSRVNKRSMSDQRREDARSEEAAGWRTDEPNIRHHSGNFEKSFFSSFLLGAALKGRLHKTSFVTHVIDRPLEKSQTQVSLWVQWNGQINIHLLRQHKPDRLFPGCEWQTGVCCHGNAAWGWILELTNQSRAAFVCYMVMVDGNTVATVQQTQCSTNQRRVNKVTTTTCLMGRAAACFRTEPSDWAEDWNIKENKQVGDGGGDQRCELNCGSGWKTVRTEMTGMKRNHKKSKFKQFQGWKVRRQKIKRGLKGWRETVMSAVRGVSKRIWRSWRRWLMWNFKIWRRNGAKRSRGQTDLRWEGTPRYVGFTSWGLG